MLTLRRIHRSGPVPRRYALVHLSRCDRCYLWEPGRYLNSGQCRRYPYPAMLAWKRCEFWTRRDEPGY